MVHVVYGPDSFTAHEVLNRLLSSQAEDGFQAGSEHRIDGKTATPSEILEAAEQVSLFGEKRLVVVEGLLARFGKSESRDKGPRPKGRRKQSSDIGEWETFVTRVHALPEASILILLDGDVSKSNPLFAALLPVATVERLEPPKKDALVQWVQRRAAMLGGRMERAAAQRLAAWNGEDLWRLSTEIEKLVVYADGRPIEVDVVDKMSSSGLAPSIFMLVDAIVEGNQKLARHRLDDMYQKGLSAGYLFTMLGRQLRLIAQVHDSRAHRGRSQPPSRELASLQPFALQKATSQAERYTEQQVRYALGRVVEADRNIKSGTYSDRVALDVLITDLVRSSRA